jgi:hypothetical protein
MYIIISSSIISVFITKDLKFSLQVTLYGGVQKQCLFYWSG